MHQLQILVQRRTSCRRDSIIVNRIEASPASVGKSPVAPRPEVFDDCHHSSQEDTQQKHQEDAAHVLEVELIHRGRRLLLLRDVTQT